MEVLVLPDILLLAWELFIWEASSPLIILPGVTAPTHHVSLYVLRRLLQIFLNNF